MLNVLIMFHKQTLGNQWALLKRYVLIQRGIQSLGLFKAIYRLLIGICSSNLKKAVEPDDTKQH